MIPAQLLLIPLALVMSQTAIKDGSKVLPLAQSTGLFYDKLSDIRTYQSQWRLVTSLDVDKYLAHAPPIQFLP